MILFVERVRREVRIYGLNPETDSHKQSIWTVTYLEGVFLCYFSRRGYQNVLCGSTEQLEE